MHYLKYLAIPVILGIIIISCEKDDTSVIDPVLNIPSISNAAFTPSSFDSDTINAVATVHVNSVDPLKQVSVTLINPLSEGEQAIELKDNGVSPDSAAGDGVFSARVIYSRTCRLVGNWSAQFLAETVEGLLSNVIQENFSVIRSNNQPPAITGIYLPDSLQAPTGNDTVDAFLKVQVTDPNGLCDISPPGAYFNSFKPDGTPSSGNPFPMYDNGIETPPFCDTVANDGKYSLRIYLFGSFQFGNYTFKFNCKDRSGSISDTLIHILNVHQ